MNYNVHIDNNEEVLEMAEEKRKEEIVERLAIGFPQLTEKRKLWMAGYIACAEDMHFERTAEEKKELVKV